MTGRPWHAFPFRDRTPAQVFIDNIDDTGGLARAPGGQLIPFAGYVKEGVVPEYLDACKAYGVDPVVRKLDGDQEEE